MSDADRLALEAVVHRWREAILAKDWTAFAALYTDDAVAMPPNLPAISGNRPIAAWFDNPGLVLHALAHTPVAVEIVGTLAVVRNAYSMTFTLPGQAAPLTEVGKSVLVVRRSRDGQWRIAIDIWNADRAAPLAADVAAG
jgi:uncharacterized protein (TIGR02246 family)